MVLKAVAAEKEKEKDSASRKIEKRDERGPDGDKDGEQRWLGDNRCRRKGARSEVGCRHSAPANMRQ